MKCLITHVRYVALGVTDLAGELEFYRDSWGLVEREHADGLAFLGAVATSDPYILRLRQTDRPRLDVISFAVPTAEDVDAYADWLRGRGIELVSGPGFVDLPGGGYGIRFFDPDGRTLEIASEVSPVESRELAAREWLPGKLSHVVVNTPNLEALTAWYGDMLRLGISDRLEDVMVFLHADNHWHHAMALARGPYSAVNHIAYETRGIDEYLRASGRLIRSGQTCVWGPGRHGPGDNTFAYFQDRNGFVAEYTTALQVVEDWAEWTPRVHPISPEWSDQWGTACARNPEPFLGPGPDVAFEAPPI